MREEPSLGWPPPSALRRFPSHVVEPDQPLWRVVRAGRDPWWFSSSGRGRFDLSPPLGTCYLAEDPVAAVLEALGAGAPAGVVPVEFLAGQRLRRLHLPSPQRLADTTARRARGFGVTAEIGILVPYVLPQAWAAAFARSGLEGVRYRARHDLGGGASVAVFGPQGGRRGWRRGRERRIEGLARRLAAEAGVVIAPLPRRAQLRVQEA